MGVRTLSNRIPGQGYPPLVQAHGTVALRESKCYAGTAKRSNNTAELSAAAEALTWLLIQADWEVPVVPRNAAIQFWFDSSYVIRLIQRQFQPRSNVFLSTLVQRLWTEASSIFAMGPPAWV